MAAPNPDLIAATILLRWAGPTGDMMREALQRADAVDTQDLLESIRWDVAGDMAKLTFLTYGRARDKGSGRSPSLSSPGAGEVATAAAGARKPAKFYSKIVYNRIYGSLIAQLVGGYREEIIRDAKGVLRGRII